MKDKNSKKVKKIFVNGPIAPEKIATSISHHQSKTNIEGHSIFLGQVKDESRPGESAGAILFSADEEAVEHLFYEIREKTFDKYDLTCMHIYHSLGEVRIGEIYFFVFTSSSNKNEATKACEYLIGEIEQQVKINKQPIFSK